SSDAQPQRTWGRDPIEISEMYLRQAFGFPGRELGHHVARQFTYGFMKGTAEVRKRGISADLALQVNGQAFGKESVSIRKIDVDQSVHDCCSAGNDFPRR